MGRTWQKELSALHGYLGQKLDPALPLSVDGVTKTVTAWLALIDAELASKARLSAARVSYLVALKADLGRRKAQRSLVTGLHATLRMTLGRNRADLDAIGVKKLAGRPKGKKPPLEKQLAALEARRKTRPPKPR